MERMSSACSLLSWVVTQNSVCPLLSQWMTRKHLRKEDFISIRNGLTGSGIEGKRFARKAWKTAGMDLLEGLEEFLLSCRDSM